jgi:hypothetical protein
VTGADTIFNLVPDDEQNGPPQANNILLVSAGATTTGSNSVIEGSILSGAAITLGAVSDEVSGGVFAKAVINVGAGCVLNKAKVLNVQSQLNTLLTRSSVPVGGLMHPLLTTDPFTDALVIQEAFALNVGELGGRTVSPGAYKTDSSITVAAGTVVTLRGNNQSKCLFISGASVVIGADTRFNLVWDEVLGTGPPQVNNILFVSAGATTMGANSKLQGSILSGAAITLAAVSEVTRDIEAKAAITIGVGSVLGGSILSEAAITLGAATRVTGGIFAKAAITIGAGCSYNVLDEAPAHSSVTMMLDACLLERTSLN